MRFARQVEPSGGMFSGPFIRTFPRSNVLSPARLLISRSVDLAVSRRGPSNRIRSRIKGQNVKRNRLWYFVAGCIVVALGLSSRRYATLLPDVLARYTGDTLYATMIFVGIGFLFPRWRSLRVAVVSLIFCFAIELSQLYHAPWIDNVRHKQVGGLVLGFGFLWSDLLCYTAGVALGLLVEIGMMKLQDRNRTVGPAV